VGRASVVGHEAGDHEQAGPPFRIVDKHPEVIRFPLMEQPLVGVVLAFSAGMMDAWTHSTATTFATVQSGNVVLTGYSLAQGDWDRFTFPFVSILCFGMGALIAGAFMTSVLRKGKTFAGGILLIEAIILAVLATVVLTTHADAHHIAYGVSFVAGAQGNAFHKDHGMLYGNVAVTFVVQMAFNFFVQSLFSKRGINGEPNLMWAGIFFSILVGFAAGGAIGALATKASGGGALFVPALVVLGLAAVSFDQERKKLDPDPTPGGLIG
jgi:uncharacterized membrane protein YoaK (UPF0700 family)